MFKNEIHCEKLNPAHLSLHTVHRDIRFCLKIMFPVADLEGVRVVRLNPPLEANYFNFMGKCMKNQVKC